MKKILYCTLLLSLIISFISCSHVITHSDSEKIEICIQNFADSYNSGDIEKALEYMTGKQKNALVATLKLLGTFTGYDAQEIFSSVFSLGIAFGDGNGDFMTVKILDIEIDGQAAIATADISFPGVNDTEADTSYFHLVKVNGDWFISDITD